MQPGTSPITLEAIAQFLPRNSLAYIVLDDGSSEVAECLQKYREALSRHHWHRLQVEKGARIADLDAPAVSPLVVGVVNKFPISSSMLPTDLNTFCARVESYLPMMLGPAGGSEQS